MKSLQEIFYKLLKLLPFLSIYLFRNSELYITTAIALTIHVIITIILIIIRKYLLIAYKKKMIASMKKINANFAIDKLLEKLKLDMANITKIEIDIDVLFDSNSRLDASCSFSRKKIYVDNSFLQDLADPTLASSSYSVLGHEYSHAKYDSRYSKYIVTLHLIIKPLLLFISTYFIFNYQYINTLITISTYFLFRLIVMPLIRKQEYRADAYSAKLFGAPLMAFVLARWDKSIGFDYFNSHPSIKKRLAALIDIDRKMQELNEIPIGLNNAYFVKIKTEPFIEEIRSMWLGDIRKFQIFACYGSTSKKDVPPERKKWDNRSKILKQYDAKSKNI